jgi:hypothetical protein
MEKTGQGSMGQVMGPIRAASATAKPSKILPIAVRALISHVMQRMGKFYRRHIQ